MTSLAVTVENTDSALSTSAHFVRHVSNDNRVIISTATVLFFCPSGIGNSGLALSPSRARVTC